MLKKARKERLIWLDIMMTLLALALMSYFYYGIRSVALCGTCVAVSLAAEVVSLRLMGRKFKADDLTCTSDALILALMLPTCMDYSIAVIASLFSVIVAKNVFGGRKNMIFSPAAAAYVFILTSWGSKLLMYPEPHTKLGAFEKPETLVHSASYSFNISGKLDFTDFEVLLGNFSGPAGAVSILLLVISAIILIFRDDISAGAFLGSMIGTGLFAFIVPVGHSREDSLSYSLVTNMVLFASIYIIADRRIAPKREYFAIFYGLFVSIFAYTLVLTTAKENAIVIVSVLFTPVTLGFKNLEKKIALAEEEELLMAAKLVKSEETEPQAPAEEAIVNE